MSDIELTELHARRQTAPEIERLTDTDTTSARDSEIVQYWAWAAALILLLYATPLLLFPRFLLFLSAGKNDAERRTALTPLESFLALHTGILLIAVALALLLNMPSHPIITPSRRSTVGHPLLGCLCGACALSAVVSFNTKSIGSLALLLSSGAGTVAMWGFWVILFEGPPSISKKTGADKHTSRFIFGNKAAASSQKKFWRRQQAEHKSG